MNKNNVCLDILREMTTGYFFLFSATAVTNKYKVSDLHNTNLFFYKSEDQESIIKMLVYCILSGSLGG